MPRLDERLVRMVRGHVEIVTIEIPAACLFPGHVEHVITKDVTQTPWQLDAGFGGLCALRAGCIIAFIVDRHEVRNNNAALTVQKCGHPVTGPIESIAARRVSGFPQGIIGAVFVNTVIAEKLVKVAFALLAGINDRVIIGQVRGVADQPERAGVAGSRKVWHLAR